MVERALGWLADRGDRLVDQLAQRTTVPVVVVVLLVVLVVLMRHFFPGGYRW